MQAHWTDALSSVFLVSLISLFGIFFISLNEERLRSTLCALISLAAGALPGDAVIHRLPQSFAPPVDTFTLSLFALTGVLALPALEKLLRRNHQHRPAPAGEGHPVGYINWLADGLHTLIDGALIVAAACRHHPGYRLDGPLDARGMCSRRQDGCAKLHIFLCESPHTQWLVRVICSSFMGKMPELLAIETGTSFAL